LKGIEVLEIEESAERAKQRRAAWVSKYANLMAPLLCQMYDAGSQYTGTLTAASVLNREDITKPGTATNHQVKMATREYFNALYRLAETLREMMVDAGSEFVPSVDMVWTSLTDDQVRLVLEMMGTAGSGRQPAKLVR